MLVVLPEDDGMVPDGDMVSGDDGMVPALGVAGPSVAGWVPICPLGAAAGLLSGAPGVTWTSVLADPLASAMGAEMLPAVVVEGAGVGDWPGVGLSSISAVRWSWLATRPRPMVGSALRCMFEDWRPSVRSDEDG